MGHGMDGTLTRRQVEDVVRAADGGGPVVVEGDDDEHEALRVERRPAHEEHQHHSNCNEGQCGTFHWSRHKKAAHLKIQGDPSGRLQPPTDLDLECSAILPGQQVTTVAAH